MNHLPDFDAFRTLAQQHTLVPVYRRLVSDTLTPVSAFHRIDTGGSACLFESVVGGEKVGRYSFLAADPFMELAASGTQVTITEPGQAGLPRRRSAAGTAASAVCGQRRSIARAAPVRRRRGGLCGLRRGALRRASSRCAAGRSPFAGPGVRLLRPDDRVRQHRQDHVRGRDGQDRAG
jgi:anthranilate/para-aminobenzoate synthase component I